MAEVKRANSAAFKVLADKIKEIDGKQVQVGWFASSRYPSGTQVALVAQTQEFGSPVNNIPPRPFMRPTIAREEQNWKALLLSGAKAVIAGNESPTTVMDKVGFKVEGDIAKSIRAVTSPPLKPATIAARARKRKDKTITATLKKPLVDTALMINTITHVVEDSQ